MKIMIIASIAKYKPAKAAIYPAYCAGVVNLIFRYAFIVDPPIKIAPEKRRGRCLLIFFSYIKNHNEWKQDHGGDNGYNYHTYISPVSVNS